MHLMLATPLFVVGLGLLGLLVSAAPAEPATEMLFPRSTKGWEDTDLFCTTKPMIGGRSVKEQIKAFESLLAEYRRSLKPGKPDCGMQSGPVATDKDRCVTCTRSVEYAVELRICQKAGPSDVESGVGIVEEEVSEIIDRMIGLIKRNDQLDFLMKIFNFKGPDTWRCGSDGCEGGNCAFSATLNGKMNGREFFLKLGQEDANKDQGSPERVGTATIVPRSVETPFTG